MPLWLIVYITVAIFAVVLFMAIVIVLAPSLKNLLIAFGLGIGWILVLVAICWFLWVTRPSGSPKK